MLFLISINFYQIYLSYTVNTIFFDHGKQKNACKEKKTDFLMISVKQTGLYLVKDFLLQFLY